MPPMAMPTMKPSDDVFARNMANKFSLGVAVGFERFDTNFNFTDKSMGRGFLYVRLWTGRRSSLHRNISSGLGK